MKSLSNFSEKQEDSNDVILVGKIVAPYGVKGLVKIRSFTENVSAFDFFKFVLLKSLETSEFVRIKLLKSFLYKKKGICLSLEGVFNRNDAQNFVGFHVYVLKSWLPVLEKDTYYWSDLINMLVKSVDGGIIGYLETIIYTGSNDVYIIKNIENKEVLIPAIKSVVLNVDLIDRLMIVKLPEDLD